MFELVYVIFLWALLLEVAIFLFLNLPTPKGWKGVAIKFLTTNKTVKKIMKVHLGLLLVAAFFMVDLKNTENKFRKDKEAIDANTNTAGGIVNELKRSYLSYNILKFQRNMYITTFLIYMSLALNAYVVILQYMYEKRENYQAERKAKSSEVQTKKVE